MNMYSFEYPYLILLLVPLLFCLYRCREVAKTKYFVHLHLLRANKRYLPLEWIVRIAVLVAAVAALCSPVVFDRDNPFNRSGKEIVLAIDASGSMNSSGFAQEEVFDLAPQEENARRLSRFEITKYIAKNFVLQRTGDNVGVVIFGDFAFIASPITYEKEVVAQMIDLLTQGMAGQNTAIGEAIFMGVRAFKHSHAKEKILILLSDGEHNSGSIAPKEAVAHAKEAGVKIYTIGIGKEGEADSALLEKIAADTQGLFFYATSAKELAAIYENIDALESSAIRSSALLQKEYLYPFLLLMACGLLGYLLYKERQRCIL
jgi:Ca-activated chloride channel family protein